MCFQFSNSPNCDKYAGLLQSRQKLEQQPNCLDLKPELEEPYTTEFFCILTPTSVHIRLRLSVKIPRKGQHGIRWAFTLRWFCVRSDD